VVIQIAGTPAELGEHRGGRVTEVELQTKKKKRGATKRVTCQDSSGVEVWRCRGEGGLPR